MFLLESLILLAFLLVGVPVLVGHCIYVGGKNDR
jgi:hypothetical protein